MLYFDAQDDGEACLAESDKKTIRENLVPLMCRAPPEVQRQVCLCVDAIKNRKLKLNNR